MADHQSSYTGAQLDAAIASYVNRTTGQIILTPDQLNGSLSGGYYSGVSASFDYSSLTAESSHVLTGKSAIGKYGKIANGGMQSGNVSLTLTPSNLSPSTSPNKYVPSASASLDYSSLTADATMVLKDKTFIGKNGVQSGSLVAASVQTGSAKATDNTHLTISDLTGTPSNLMLMYDFSASGNSNYQVYALYYINSTYVHIAKSTGSTTQRRTSGTVTFNHSAGTCSITLSYDRFVRSVQGDKYKWVVW